MRVLIVDDHEVVRQGVRSLLLSRGHLEVCGEAVDGQDAVEKAKQLKPDVIIMDISMPNLNGLEATRQIRNILPQAKIVILSQHESSEMVHQAFLAGARGYVVKTSMSEDLLVAMERAGEPESYVGSVARVTANTHIDAAEILQRSATLEQTLHGTEELYRSTFEQAPMGVTHVSPDGRWLRVNQKFCSMVGYTEKELLNLRYQDITHPDDLACDVANGEEILAGRSEQYSMEKRYVRKDGSPVWVNLTVSCVRHADGQVKYFISIVEDIKERKEFEAARFTLAAIVESSDDAIVSKDLNGIIKSWNAGAQRIFGYTAEEAIGKPITIIIPLELRDEETQILKRLRAGERIEHYETVRATKTGGRRTVSLTISPVKDSKGRVIGASKIVRDITEQKQSEESVLSARLLQAQDEERRRIARELHDSVGQLLAAIGMNTAHVAAESRNLSPGAAKAVADNAGLVQQVTDEVRTISHLLHPPLLDEVGLASALRWYIDGFAERSKIPVTLEIPPKFGRMPRDHEMALFRIIQECLTNIHRHSRSQTALVRLTIPDNQIRLEVKDEGKGISSDIQSTMLAGHFPGVGLRGMRERVKQLGGRLDIQSNASGTAVIAVLPVETKQTRGGNESGGAG
ncbi:MAG TPA: PAS domain S-box protein [Candidatus Dormibacteraeota bacterium]|nr:PAS domain S-box protein [Candidatus Dormibacteraeota bacterium]